QEVSLMDDYMCASFPPRKYVPVISYEQCQRYKEDFRAEYDEYRELCARMESVSRRFQKLEAQWRDLPPGSEDYEVKKDKTV
ncbi:ELL2 factor, partial [Bucco capensis]|nr:ELL2 factor [Bucco capensis]